HGRLLPTIHRRIHTRSRPRLRHRRPHPQRNPVGNAKTRARHERRHGITRPRRQPDGEKLWRPLGKKKPVQLWEQSNRSKPKTLLMMIGFWVTKSLASKTACSKTPSCTAPDTTTHTPYSCPASKNWKTNCAGTSNTASPKCSKTSASTAQTVRVDAQLNNSVNGTKTGRPMQHDHRLRTKRRRNSRRLQPQRGRISGRVQTSF